jgi:hypothetical protein
MITEPIFRWALVGLVVILILGAIWCFSRR